LRVPGGLAADGLKQEELDYHDRDYQVLICIRAVKGRPDNGPGTCRIADVRFEIADSTKKQRPGNTFTRSAGSMKRASCVPLTT